MKKRILIVAFIGEARNSEPLRVGIPFALGELDNIDGIALLDNDGQSIPVQATTSCFLIHGSQWRLETLKNKDPRFCGGSPSAEYCYTSGLVKGKIELRRSRP